VDLEDVKVIHAIPGRIRLKVPELKDNPVLAEAVQERLSSVPAVGRVETNPVTGSVLVVYDVDEVASLDSIHALSEVLTPLFPTLDAGQIHARLSRPPANGSRSQAPSSLDKRISGLFGSLNVGVEKVTGGTDLKVLLPVALFCLGIRGLVASEKLSFPAWYDFLWFAFGTFLALNPATGPPASAHAP
jgi:hypothetical protein